jgi:hypothetical protein
MKCIVFVLCASLVLVYADALLLPPISDPSLVMNAQDLAMLPLTSDHPYDFVEGDLSGNDPYSDGEFYENFGFTLVYLILTAVDDNDRVEVISTILTGNISPQFQCRQMLIYINLLATRNPQ